MNATPETPERVAENGSGRSQQRDGSTAPPELKLTAKEELAVIVERLRQHKEDAKDEGAKVRLDLAADLVRAAIHRR